MRRMFSTFVRIINVSSHSMKTATTILILFLTVNLTVANDIDNLKTVYDVQKFLVEKVNKKWKSYKLIENNTTDTSVYGKGKFFKIDLDNNGLTDLVINGKRLFAVTDNGKGQYESHIIDRGAFDLDKYTLTNIIYNDKTPLLIICAYFEYEHRLRDDAKPDTLVFKFDDFIEYNPIPDTLVIEEINFSTSGCYGTCPIFELVIKSDRSSTYNAIEYNKKKGIFKSIIDTVSYNKLLSTLNYIKIASLNDKYHVSWTDDQTVTLEIKYNNGQTKKISDYGSIGTFGLENLYNQLFALRRTQKWK